MENTLRGRIVALITACLLGSVGLSTLPTAAAAPPVECLSYVHSMDAYGTIFTLMKNNSAMFGDRATYVSDCESDVEVYIDGQARAYLNSTGGSFNLLFGSHTYDLRFSDGSFITYRNVSVYPSQAWESTYYSLEPSADPSLYFYEDRAELQARDVLITVGSAIIIWAVSTMIIWRIINHYVDTRFIEEVVG